MCVIDHGRIAVIGTPDELKRQLLDRVDRARRRRPAGARAPSCAALGLDPVDEPDGLVRVRLRRRRPRRRSSPRIRTPLSRAAGPRAQPRGGLRRAPPRSPRRPSHERRATTAARRRRPRAARRAGAGQPAARPSAREANATFAIAWREVLRAVKSPLSLAFTVIFPVLFIGILGGSISQNLGGALPFAYLPFMLIGMIANTMYQGTITGVTNLVEERENDFTAELFVAPISRYAVLLGKLHRVGRSPRMFSLVGIIAMIFVMQIPMDAGDLLRVIALTPVLALAGGALGVFFIGLDPGPEDRRDRRPAADLPADVPVRGAHPGRELDRASWASCAKIIPMTYSIDLARNIFYWGKPEYAAAVLHAPWLDLAVTVGFFLVFTIVGTFLFVRADRNR